MASKTNAPVARVTGRVVLMAMLLSIAAAGLAAEPGEQEARPQVAANIAEAIWPSLVRVEYTLQYDQGETPVAAGWRTRCPNCGGYHRSDAEETLRQERPAEAAGFLIAPDLVLAADPMVHPRFVQRIVVIDGEDEVALTPHAFALQQNAVLLRAERPLTRARPLEFSADSAAPWFAVSYSPENGEWAAAVQPAGGVVAHTERQRRFVSVPSFSVLVDEEARVAGVAMRENLPVDDSWKGSPEQWELISAAALAERLAELERQTAAGLLRVTMNFRSPRTSSDPMQMLRRRGNDDEEATVRHAAALRVNERQLLVLAELRPSVTARLERIRLHLPDGSTATARFVCTLRDYGALLAELETPLAGGFQISERDVRDYRDELLLAVEAKLQGEQLTVHYDHRRLTGFRTGWRRQHYPELAGESKDLLLFDRSGTLIALPMTRRQTAAEEDRWRRDSDRILTAAVYLAPILREPSAHADPSNVPLGEAEENRLAWLGVELQPLDPDLAQVNNVAHLTRDGETGALITHVYPDSPAARASVEPGWILLRLHVEGRPRPINVQLDRWTFRDEPFPWDQLGMVPEEYFEHIPTPWPPAENGLARTLTDLGFGKTFTAEFARDGGQIVTHGFAVEQSPAHYGSAAQSQLRDTGLTLRDMTYEVRRYFQRAADDPGVIISRIEPGSRASVAGLKPYEFITHVNDQAVTSVAELERLLEDATEVRMSVRRMAQGRIVNLRLE